MAQNQFFRKQIKNILIVYRDNSSGIIHIVNQVEKWLKKHKINTQTFSQSSLSNNPSTHFDIDLILVLGGDGTYLKAVQCTPSHSVPFLGINMGSFGFLTVHRQELVIHCLESTLQGKMALEERSLIDASLITKEEQNHNTFLALNDVVIERGSFSHLINISITIQDQDIYSLTADGVIVSSPTGSTAYNLAAGGPILHPQVNSFAITPICSHSLTNRPVIVPDTYEMFFRINNENQSAFLTIDGQKMAKMSKEQSVKIKKSTMKHRTLRQVEHNDFLLLKDKLKFFQ